MKKYTSKCITLFSPTWNSALGNCANYMAKWHFAFLFKCQHLESTKSMLQGGKKARNVLHAKKRNGIVNLKIKRGIYLQAFLDEIVLVTLAF